MHRYNPNWFARILRNSEPEVHVTVIDNPVNPSDIAPVEPTVPEVLGAAAAVIGMAGELQQQNAPVDRSGEMISLLNDVVTMLGEVRDKINSPVVIVEPEPVIDVPVTPEPEIIVAAGDIKKETITEVPPTDGDAPPKSRKRRWAGE